MFCLKSIFDHFRRLIKICFCRYNKHTSNITQCNNKRILLLDTIKSHIIIRNTLKILLFDNTLENYLINLNDYKKFKYFVMFF